MHSPVSKTTHSESIEHSLLGHGANSHLGGTLATLVTPSGHILASSVHATASLLIPGEYIPIIIPIRIRIIMVVMISDFSSEV